MKVDRLFSIVHILLNREHVTAKELADKFQVSTRTIYRDIDCLSMSGIPVYTDKGKGGGIGLLEDFVLNKSLISMEEKNSILMGLEVLQATQYDEVSTAITKLKDLFHGDYSPYIEVDFSEFDNEKQQQLFKTIKQALINNEFVNMEYRKSTGEMSIRTIAPLKLVFKQQRWYLIAFCKVKKDYRTFRVSRILMATSTGEKFNRELFDISDFVLKSHGLHDLSPIKLIMRKEARFRVEEEFYGNLVRKIEGDILSVEFESQLDEWLISYIISYADYLVDIEPKEVKNMVQKQAKKIMSL